MLEIDPPALGWSWPEDEEDQSPNTATYGTAMNGLRLYNGPAWPNDASDPFITVRPVSGNSIVSCSECYPPRCHYTRHDRSLKPYFHYVCALRLRGESNRNTIGVSISRQGTQRAAVMEISLNTRDTPQTNDTRNVYRHLRSIFRGSLVFKLCYFSICIILCFFKTWALLLVQILSALVLM